VVVKRGTTASLASARNQRSGRVSGRNARRRGGGDGASAAGGRARACRTNLIDWNHYSYSSDNTERQHGQHGKNGLLSTFRYVVGRSTILSEGPRSAVQYTRPPLPPSAGKEPLISKKRVAISKNNRVRERDTTRGW
jgi:hypothetical protein